MRGSLANCDHCGSGIGGEYSPKDYGNHQFSVVQGGPVIEQLELEPHDPVETLKATVDSLMMCGRAFLPLAPTCLAEPWRCCCEPLLSML